MSKFHLTFDGAGYVRLSADAPKYSTGDFSIEVKYRVPAGGGGYLWNGFYNVGVYAFGVRISVDQYGRPTALLAAWTKGVNIVCTGSFTTSTWYHAVLSCDRNGSAQWYINGQARNSAAITQLVGDIDTVQKHIGVLYSWPYGPNPESYSDYYTGDIYNLGYYTGKALTQSEVQARYQAVDFAGTEDGLAWASNMNTGSGLTCYDMMAGFDGIISSLDHVGWEITDIAFTTPYEMVMRHVPGRGNLISILMPPFGGLGGLVGGFRIYRGQDGNINYDDIVATMAEGDTQVVISGQDLPPNTSWHYVRRKVQSCCGLESPDSPACIVVIGADGEMIGNVPNTPQNVTAGQLAGAKINIKWRYTPLAQEAAPTGFKIYMDSGSEFDFESPVATVAYNLGELGEFDWTSGALADGHTYRFCVRSYREGGGESRNTDYTSTVADSTGPDAITGICATWQEVPG